MNLSEQLLNPRKYAVRKWLSEILGERYAKHDLLVERVGHYLVTKKDLEDFGKLVSDLYEVGYLKCLEDYREGLKAHGFSVKVKYIPHDEE